MSEERKSKFTMLLSVNEQAMLQWLSGRDGISGADWLRQKIRATYRQAARKADAAMSRRQVKR